LSAGIGTAAGPELVSAVSNAGGFGVLGMSGLEPAEMRRLIGRTRELTDRPFGVNVIIDEEGWAASEEDMEHLRVTHRDPGHVLDRHGLLVVGLLWPAALCGS
jgi:NAD(P)H-dependent flavin oxidoreductase YrpB (nitropropane dioxygenase family)